MTTDGDDDDDVRDARLLAQLRRVDRLLETRRTLSALMREGFFELFQAKTAMGGHKSVSAAHYDSRMAAGTLVSHERTSDPGQGPFCLHYLRSSAGPSTAATSTTSVLTSSPPPTPPMTSGGASTAAAFSDAGPSLGTFTPSDPLKWFGVLAPPHLRKSQESFVQALKVMIELANLQYQLEMSSDSSASPEQR